MRAERPHEALAEAPGHVVDTVRGDRERVVEAVADPGPRVEIGRQEDQQPAPVDRADAPTERVRNELLVAVEDDDVARPTEQSVRAARSMLIEPKPLPGGDDRDRVLVGADGVDRVVRGVDPAVAVAGTDENAPLVRRLGLPFRLAYERRDHRSTAVTGGEKCVFPSGPERPPPGRAGTPLAVCEAGRLRTQGSFPRV